MIQEVWKDIKEYEGIYAVSNLGRVKSLKRFSRNWHAVTLIKEKFLKLGKTKQGYLSCALHKGKGIQQSYFIHRLVAMTFIPNPENKPTVNHKDGNTSNNNVTNLEWATKRENQLHAYKTGLQKVRYGSELVYTKISEGEIPKIKKLGETMFHREIAQIYNVHRVTITNILNNKRRLNGTYNKTESGIRHHISSGEGV